METRAVRCPGFYLSENEGLNPQNIVIAPSDALKNPINKLAQLTVSSGVV
jgi:hypothetical protein